MYAAGDSARNKKKSALSLYTMYQLSCDNSYACLSHCTMSNPIAALEEWPSPFQETPDGYCVEMLRADYSFRIIRGGEVFFCVSRRFASRIHEISDLKEAPVLSLRAECTRLRDKKHTERERNAKR